MDWTLLVLILLLFALWAIKSALDKIVASIDSNLRQISVEIASQPQAPAPYPLDGIEQQLQYIVTLMGGDEKFAEMKKKHRKELRERVIKAIMYAENKSEKEAKTQADKLWEDAEFEEKQNDYSSKFDNYERWVINQEKDQRNRTKYGHLLLKARQYLKGVKQIDRYDHKMQDYLKTDWNGEQWLLEKLVQEKRLKKVTEREQNSDSFLDREVLKHYEVVQS